MQPRVDEKFRNVNDGTDDDGPAGGGKKKGVDCVSGQDYHGRKFLYEPGSDTSPMQGSITNFSCASLPLGETLGLRVIVYWQFLDLLLQIECKKTRKIRVSHVGRRDYRNEITTKKIIAPSVLSRSPIQVLTGPKRCLSFIIIREPVSLRVIGISR